MTMKLTPWILVFKTLYVLCLMSLKVTLVRNTSERKVFTVQLMFMNDVFFESANVPQLLRTNPTKRTRDT